MNLGFKDGWNFGLGFIFAQIFIGIIVALAGSVLFGGLIAAIYSGAK